MKQKYTLEQIKEMIESDEPTFMLRGNDLLSLPTIRLYGDMYSKLPNRDKNYKSYKEFRKNLDTIIAEFAVWSVKQESKMKMPCLKKR